MSYRATPSCANVNVPQSFKSQNRSLAYPLLHLPSVHYLSMLISVLARGSNILYSEPLSSPTIHSLHCLLASSIKLRCKFCPHCLAMSSSSYCRAAKMPKSKVSIYCCLSDQEDVSMYIRSVRHVWRNSVFGRRNVSCFMDDVWWQYCIFKKKLLLKLTEPHNVKQASTPKPFDETGIVIISIKLKMKKKILIA